MSILVKDVDIIRSDDMLLIDVVASHVEDEERWPEIIEAVTPQLDRDIPSFLYRGEDVRSVVFVRRDVREEQVLKTWDGSVVRIKHKVQWMFTVDVVREVVAKSEAAGMSTAISDGML